MTTVITRRTVVELVLVVLGLVAVGAVAGVVWEWVWTPTDGVVAEDAQGVHVWSTGGALGLQQQFSGTGWYVVVGVLAGLLAGVVVGLLADSVPLLTLAAVVVGSALAAWVMLVVGTSLGPPDPEGLVAAADVGSRMPGDLEVSGRSPWIALPVGALIGLALVFIGLAPRASADDRSEAGGELPTEAGRAG